MYINIINIVHYFNHKHFPFSNTMLEGNIVTHSTTQILTRIRNTREKVREWVSWRATRLQREWGALGGGAGALEQLAALAAALPTRALAQQRAALTHLRDTLLNHDVSPFEVSFNCNFFFNNKVKRIKKFNVSILQACWALAFL